MSDQPLIPADKQAEDQVFSQNENTSKENSSDLVIEIKEEHPSLHEENQDVSESELSAGHKAKASHKHKNSSKTEDELLFEAALASLENVETPQGDTSSRKLVKGDRIEATVIQVEKDRVFVDLGTKSEGVVPLGELTEKHLETAEGHVQVGDKIQVVVLRPEGAEGNPIVSKKRADFEAAWDKVIAAHQSGEMLSALVIDRVKGGLVVDVGVRGFVPATHVGSGKLRNIDKFVGQSLNLKVIEIDKERKKVILSNRDAEAARREKAREELLQNLTVGDVVPGVVRRVTDYGAFIDLGGLDGLLHISEMSWARINHPKDVLKEGQEIQVMVLKMDSQTAKISLGLRQVLPDPWKSISEHYKPGNKIPGKISRIVLSGAFVRLEEGIEAFLPIGEISYKHIKKVSDVLTEGQDVEVKILDVRPNERRMVLSLKDGSGGEGSVSESSYSDRESRPKKKNFRSSSSSSSSSKKDRSGEGAEYAMRAPSGGATIGERLGALRGLLSDANKEQKPKPAEPRKKNKSQFKEVEDALVELEEIETPIDDLILEDKQIVAENHSETETVQELKPEDQIQSE